MSDTWMERGDAVDCTMCGDELGCDSCADTGLMEIPLAEIMEYNRPKRR